MKRRLPWTEHGRDRNRSRRAIDASSGSGSPGCRLHSTHRSDGCIEGLAKCADLSPHSIWSWTSGRRSPSGESVSKLADELDRRSVELADLAKKLRDAAER